MSVVPVPDGCRTVNSAQHPFNKAYRLRNRTICRPNSDGAANIRNFAKALLGAPQCRTVHLQSPRNSQMESFSAEVAGMDEITLLPG